jgi:glycosyltransferase involved in cell wall biosynthesis
VSRPSTGTPLAEDRPRMRIAQVAPLAESVPPRGYGGTERIVSYLTEALVAAGHDVTLYASGESKTSARLVPGWPRSLRLDRKATDSVAPHFVMLERLFSELDRYDVVHFHVDYLHFPFSARADFNHVTTMHGRLDLPELVALHRAYPRMPVISISHDQRRPLPQLTWAGTVYHGLPTSQYEPSFTPGDYLVFVGRFSQEKRVDRAIDIAIRAGLPLKIAAKRDKLDLEYIKAVVDPLLDHPMVEYLGEIGDEAKNRLIAGAAALLFPIDWPEPFGLVAIEALACGTPVIAWRNGALPELIEDGTTGFLIESIDQGVRAVRELPRIDRRTCRRVFEKRFSADRMARDYLTLYEQLIAAGEKRGRRHPGP